MKGEGLVSSSFIGACHWLAALYSILEGKPIVISTHLGRCFFLLFKIALNDDQVTLALQSTKQAILPSKQLYYPKFQ